MAAADEHELNPVVKRVIARAQARRGDAELAKPHPCSEEFTGETVVIEGHEFVVLTGVYIHRVTPKAVQITFDEDVFWVPKGQINEPEQFSRWQEDCRMLVKTWFARKARLI